MSLLLLALELEASWHKSDHHGLNHCCGLLSPEKMISKYGSAPQTNQWQSFILRANITHTEMTRSGLFYRR